MLSDIDLRLNLLCDKMSSMRGEQTYKEDIRMQGTALKPELADVWVELTIAHALIREYEMRGRIQYGPRTRII